MYLVLHILSFCLSGYEGITNGNLLFLGQIEWLLCHCQYHSYVEVRWDLLKFHTISICQSWDIIC